MAKRPMGQVGVVLEFSGAELGDARRTKRLEKIVTLLDQQPDASFPQAMASEADLEAFYRFVRNEEVGFEALFAPHATATINRLSAFEEVLAVHDTTEFRYGGAREGLGRLKKAGHGFFGHFTHVVTADEQHAPLGTIALEAWARLEPTPTALRQQKKITYAQMHAMPSEQDRWLRSVDAAELATDGRSSLIHVMDSEADDYCLMAALVQTGRRWVIRLCYDRKLADVSEGEPAKVLELVASRSVACTREVNVSRRRAQPGAKTHRRRTARQQRMATLAISATRTIFRAPPYIANDVAQVLPVHIVAAREIDPPTDQEPIEWLLITTEPIDTNEQILKVVDAYRGRWVIEEFFKALKTGCVFEERQLESWQTIQNALALFLPVAWRLLDLRTCSRDNRANQPARRILTHLELAVLRHASRVPLPENPTVHDVLLAIARLGGHLRSNGEPGWQVLGRGYQDLLMMVVGFKLAMVAANM